MKYEVKLQHITAKLLEIQIKDQLLRLLDDIPYLKDLNVYTSETENYDIVAEAITELGNRLVFCCEVKNSGEPRYVRDASKKLLEHREYANKVNQAEYYFLIAAPYISEKSSKICEEHDMGYIDLSGNCLIKFKGIYIRVEGKPNKYKDAKKRNSIYERNAVKSSIILRTLLSNPKKQWRIKDLAEETTTSLGQVSNVKRFLEEKEYILNEERGFYVSRPKDLLEDWAKVYHDKPNTVVECYSMDPIPLIEKKFCDLKEKKGIEYALTGFSGSVRYTPVVRYNKVHVYIPYQDLQETMDFVGLKRVESGSNISIIIPYDPCVFLDTREIQGTTVASPAQVCLELMGLKGRGEEAAVAILNSEVFR